MLLQERSEYFIPNGLFNSSEFRTRCCHFTSEKFCVTALMQSLVLVFQKGSKQKIGKYNFCYQMVNHWYPEELGSGFFARILPLAV